MAKPTRVVAARTYLAARWIGVTSPTTSLESASAQAASKVDAAQAAAEQYRREVDAERDRLAERDTAARQQIEQTRT